MTHESSFYRAGEEYHEQLRKLKRGYTDPAYFPERVPNFNTASSVVKPLAYYLPQFHPIKENDKWWGKGFTEWTNVAKGRPQYPGHYQPHLPADLGFYDLRSESVLPAQVNMAKQYGIHGFVFYYYWFDGHRLLERPLDDFIQRTEIDFPFALCWANENWTRRWDGAESEVLMGQSHTAESDKRFILDTLEYMRDPRYIRIDGRPILIIYRIGLLPHLEETVETWRRLARERLGSDLYLIYAMTFGETRHPSTFGFDAAIQFPPHAVSTSEITEQFEPYSETFEGHIFDYEGLASDARAMLNRCEYPVIPGVFPHWDNTARRGDQANSYFGSSPDTYANWLSEAASYAASHPINEQSFIVINAWNEWAEGAHLEPDQHNGHAYLRTTADVLRPFATDVESFRPTTDASLKPSAYIPGSHGRATGETAVIVHAYYPGPLSRILQSIPENRRPDVFITLESHPDPEILKTIALDCPGARLLFYPNRGRDVRPFLGALDRVANEGYNYFVKLHTKRTVHRKDGDKWANELCETLLALLQNGQMEQLFAANPGVGSAGAAGHLLNGHTFMGSAGNVAWLEKLQTLYGVHCSLDTFSFIAGSMFAGRVDLFKQLCSFPAVFEMFEDEMGRRDGTLAHAFERFFGMIVAEYGMQIASIIVNGEATEFAVHPPENSHYEFAQAQIWRKTG